MNIRERRAIHHSAAEALNRAPQARQIILVYAAVCCGLSLLSTLLSVFLSDRISGTGGLGNIGLRSVLSTGQSVLPLINFIVTSCLTIGYHTAILSFTRGYDASPRTLTNSFRYFGPILRTVLFQVVIYGGTMIASIYISASIFMSTPYSETFVQVMTPYLESMTVLSDGLVIDDALMATALTAMKPMMWILAAVFLVLMLPLYYRMRMVDFALADDPAKGAFHAVFKSRFLMRRNRFALFRLDLTLWWFYAAQLVISLVCYGDMLLPMLGISFPWSDTFSYYLFYALYLLMQLALYCFGMNRVYAVYAVAYDALMEDFPQPELPVQQ